MMTDFSLLGETIYPFKPALWKYLENVRRTLILNHPDTHRTCSVHSG